MLTGLAPHCKVLAIVEQQVVALLANATHGPAQGQAGGIGLRVINHPWAFAAAEVFKAAAQDLLAFEVVGDASIPKVNAVVHEQPVAPWHLEVITRCHRFRPTAVPDCWGVARLWSRGALPPGLR